MASNFQIYSLKTRESLHLRLAGDFGGSSAYELINIISEHGKIFYEIFIDTNNLKSIHPYGREVFQKRLNALKKKFHSINFVGRNGNVSQHNKPSCLLMVAGLFLFKLNK